MRQLVYSSAISLHKLAGCTLLEHFNMYDMGDQIFGTAISQSSNDVHT